MSGCDISSFGGGFTSKKNKTSQRIDVSELGGVLTHNVKDSEGRVVESREFRPGDWVTIARSLKPGQELTEEFVANNNVQMSSPGRIQGFWTVIDNGDTSAAGAEVTRPSALRRVPLRMLWPAPAPEKPNKEEHKGEQKNVNGSERED